MAKERNEVAESLKWRVEDIYETIEDWERDYAAVSGKLDFSHYEGKLADADTLLECLSKLNEVSYTLSHLGVYAFMRQDEDTRKSEYAALQSRVDMLSMKLAGSTAFMTPELTALDTEILEGFMKDPRFADYDYTIRGIIAEKPHVLSKECEALLSQEGRIFGGFSRTFSMLNNADFPYPTIMVNGQKVEVTHGTYGVLLSHPDRNVRRKAFKAFYKVFMGFANTITSTFVGNIDKDVFLARARKYPSCLAKALAQEDVDVKVYENLLESVNKNLPLLHRYFDDKRKIMGMKKLHMYDVYVSPVEDAEIKLEYEEAYKLVKEGLAPLGEEYATLLDRAHDEGWIDVEETAGKRSGAYSVSVYGLKHPYVLLNYQKTTGNIFTIAHELGHAMHSYYSEKNQPQEKAGYKIFVAEVASTVNEILLLKHLLKKTDDPKLKKYLLSYYMDTLKGTLFRQTQFAEFEAKAHEMAETNQPMTVDTLSDFYGELNYRYYGDAVNRDEDIRYEWARIPHFYNAFYVYKYATGITSAINIASMILKEGQPAVDRYKAFLKSGGSDTPVELLKIAGVNLETEAPFNYAMQEFKAALDELTELTK